MESTKLQKSKNIRYSGIELLRILTICGVILLHYNDGRALKWVDQGTVNKYILFGIESMCICVVDLFMVISFFLSKTQKRAAIKPLELLFQVVLINVCFEVCGMVARRGANISMHRLLMVTLPANYFVTLYIVVYILSPWLNLLLDGLDNRQLRRLLIMVLILFSVLPTLSDLLEEFAGKESMGINTVGAWGAQQGFTAINFMLCYM